jgi:hypothetical protein
MTSSGMSSVHDAHPGREADGRPSGHGERARGYHYEPAVRAELVSLRADFPQVGFLVIKHWWYAIQGRHRVLMSSGPAELRRALTSFLRGDSAEPLRPEGGAPDHVYGPVGP